MARRGSGADGPRSMHMAGSLWAPTEAEMKLIKFEGDHPALKEKIDDLLRGRKSAKRIISILENEGHYGAYRIEYFFRSDLKKPRHIRYFLGEYEMRTAFQYAKQYGTHAALRCLVLDVRESVWVETEVWAAASSAVP